MQESSDATAYKVLCGKCGNPLGHEFLKDGPDGKGSRFWIFSHSLKFVANKDQESEQWTSNVVWREMKLIFENIMKKIDGWEDYFTSILHMH